MFAVAINLVPPDDRVSKAAGFFSVERCLLWGATLFAAGVFGSVYAVLLWEQSAFGPLGEAYTMRLVIFCVTAMIVGVQTILMGFFLGILALYKHR